MQDYLIHDSNGRIMTRARMPDAMIDIQDVPAGCTLVRAACDINLDWVEAGQVKPRPSNTATLDGMSLRNLPAPCTIEINGEAHDCTDKTADLSFSQPGTYRVVVSAWPMLDAVFEVTQE
ncbi:hypothetical protein [Burkholderia vietnamiensis]|uniref:hypothetical protein n=1 Tax=Burkholderia vietnamiensis TaxID=60552 RepID=UPI001CB087FD|nr:hypothetical protein [Burkholderia vietnamiensis]CAG9228915.1 conserved hypothetical protein [Burkholderia vietnamiensis]HDR9086350.1 hypothetical protein [Burkholderia vietnamiensis]